MWACSLLPTCCTVSLITLIPLSYGLGLIHSLLQPPSIVAFQLGLNPLYYLHPPSTCLTINTLPCISPECSPRKYLENLATGWDGTSAKYDRDRSKVPSVLNAGLSHRVAGAGGRRSQSFECSHPCPALAPVLVLSLMPTPVQINISRPRLMNKHL